MDQAMQFIFAALNLILALLAVIISLLAYDVSRARQPFTMSDAVAGVAVLTYNHIWPVVVESVFVFEVGGLDFVGDELGEGERQLTRDQQKSLDCQEINPGNAVTVQYRRKWGRKVRYWTAPLRVVS